MKILVLSDSHGAVDNMIRCVELTQPRQIFHLGDCVRDAQQSEAAPWKPLQKSLNRRISPTEARRNA